MRPHISRTRSDVSVIAALIACLFGPAGALNNGVGLTPALGWSSWNYFENDINESLVHRIADELVATGLVSAGYRYLNLDAGVWLPNRTSDGRIQSDPAKFPSGLPALSSYLAARNLTLGLYTDLSSRAAGKVCGTGPGSYGSYEDDAKTIAEVAGFIKVDYCAYDQKDPSRYHPPIPEQEVYWGQFRDAFNHTGKPMYLYFCPRSFVDSVKPPVYDGPPRAWTAELRRGLANTLLTEYHNAQDSWTSAMSNLDALLDLTNVSYSGAGFWQDADMLQTCNFGGGRTPGGGMTQGEYNAVFVTWAVLASTMIISTDIGVVSRVHPECLALLGNRRILNVNQDPAAHAPFVVFSRPPGRGATEQSFARLLHDGSVALVLLNRGATSTPLSVRWADVGLRPRAGTLCDVIDLFTGDRVTVGVGLFGLTVTVASHTAAAVRVSCPTV